MKRSLRILLTSLLLGLPSLVCAQNDNPVWWGVKGSLDLEFPGSWHSSNNTVEMYRPGVGFNIGAVSNIYIGHNFYIEPGVALFYSQYLHKDLILTDGSGYVEERDPKLYKWGVQIPVTVGYTINFSDRFALSIFTGPQIRYAFTGKIAVKNKDLLQEGDSSLDLWGVNGHRRFDLEWKVGLGIPLGNYTVSAEGDFGITDIMRSYFSFRENRVGVSVTRYF